MSTDSILSQLFLKYLGYRLLGGMCPYGAHLYEKPNIDKQKSLRRDCIYNIENRCRNGGFGRLLTVTIMFLTHTCVPSFWLILRVLHQAFEMD